MLCHLLWLCSVRLINLELGVMCICGLSTLSSNSGIKDNFRKAVCIGAVLTLICVTRSHYAVVLNIIVPWLRQLVTGLPLQKSQFTPRPVCVWDLWLTNWHLFRFFSEYFCFSLVFTSVFHNEIPSTYHWEVVILVIEVIKWNTYVWDRFCSMNWQQSEKLASSWKETTNQASHL